MDIVVIFDRLVRAETTGSYCLQALERLGHRVMHYEPFVPSPGALSFDGYRRMPTDADLYLSVDDDLTYPGPVVNAPSVYWCIDVHRMDALLGGGNRWDKMRGFDLVCSAQRDMAEQLSVSWLPLACDPTMSHPIDTPKLFSWSFVGSMVTDKRQACIDQLRNAVPGGVVATAYGAAMNALYAASQLVVNVSFSNDVNMRFFEALASGTPLLSTRPRNGEEELFDTVLWFEGERDIAAAAEGALAAPEQLHQLGLAGAEHAMARHSYTVRMSQLLELVGTTSVVPDGAATPSLLR